MTPRPRGTLRPGALTYHVSRITDHRSPRQFVRTDYFLFPVPSPRTILGDPAHQGAAVSCGCGGWGVAIRTFRDARGREWQVWETVPQGGGGQYATRLELSESVSDRLSGRVR